MKCKWVKLVIIPSKDSNEYNRLDAIGYYDADSSVDISNIRKEELEVFFLSKGNSKKYKSIEIPIEEAPRWIQKKIEEED